MDALIIAVSVVFAGFIFKQQRSNSKREPLENIYNSTKGDDSREKLQKIADSRVQDAKNPDFSGIVDPNRLIDRDPVNYSIGVVGTAAPIGARGGGNLRRAYDSNFTDIHPTGTTVGKTLTPMFSGSQIMYDKTSKSPLSGISDTVLEQLENNQSGPVRSMGYFQGTNMKTPTYSARVNTMTGVEKPRKAEVETFNHGIAVENPRVKMGYVDSSQYGRMGVSRFRQGELLYSDPIREYAPKAGTLESTFNSRKERSLEEIRVNPKTQYNGRVVPGTNPTTYQPVTNLGLDTKVRKPRTFETILSGYSSGVKGPSHANFAAHTRTPTNTVFEGQVLSGKSVHTQPTTTDSTNTRVGKETFTNNFSKNVFSSQAKGGIEDDYGKSNTLIYTRDSLRDGKGQVLGAVSQHGLAQPMNLKQVPKTTLRQSTAITKETTGVNITPRNAIGPTVETSGIATKTTLRQSKPIQNYTGIATKQIANEGYTNIPKHIKTTLRADNIKGRTPNGSLLYPEPVGANTYGSITSRETRDLGVQTREIAKGQDTGVRTSFINTRTRQSGETFSRTPAGFKNIGVFLKSNI